MRCGGSGYRCGRGRRPREPVDVMHVLLTMEAFLVLGFIVLDVWMLSFLIRQYRAARRDENE